MELRLLGSLDVDTGNGKIVIPAGKPRSLLVLLALHPNEPVGSDAIVDALWGEAPPASATAIVQTYVSRLRKALGNGRIETIGHGYRLVLADGARDIDHVETLRKRASSEAPSQAAESLREALSLFRGQPLADVAGEEFAQAELRRLEELRSALVSERIDADVRAGRHAEVLAELEGLVASRPLDERLRGLLMLALYRSGRQADALAAYQDTRSTLKDELGLEPSEELRTLQRRILEHDPALLDTFGSDVLAHPSTSESSQRRRIGVIGAAAGLALILAAVVVAGAFAVHDRGSGLVPVVQNSVAVVDPESMRVVASIPVGRRPTLVTATRDSVWVASTRDRVLTRLDPRTYEVQGTVGLGFEATDIEAVGDGVWVVGGYDHALWRVDRDGLPRVKLVFDERYPLPEGFERGPAGLASSRHGLWLAHGQEVTLLDPVTGEATADVKIGGPWASAIAVGDRGFVAKSGEAAVQTFDPSTLELGPSVSPLLGATREIAPLWAIASDIHLRRTPANQFGPPGEATWIGWRWGQAWSLTSTNEVLVLARIVDVGGQLEAIAFVDDSIWVVTRESLESKLAGTRVVLVPTLTPVVERVDPITGGVEGTVELAHTPEDAVGAHGRLWIAVR